MMCVESMKLVIQTLSSSKVTDRKKAAKDLSEALNTPEVVEAFNTDHGDTPKYESSIWSKAFLGAHQALLLEADKVVAAEQKKAILAPAIENNLKSSAALVANVLKKANQGQPRLPYFDVLSSCLKIFREEYLCRIFGLDYLSILVKNFLPVREYRSSIKKPEWIELLKLLLKLWDGAGQANVQTYSVLEAIRGVVCYGTVQCALSLQVKGDVMRMLVKHKALLRNTSLTEPYLELVQCFCSVVGVESRTSVCYLGEVVLTTLFESAELMLGNRRVKSVVVELVLFQVRCHHPGGALEGSYVAYASDRNIWKKCLLRAFRLVMSQFLINNPSSTLIDLAVEVCNQIFHSTDLVDTDDGDSSVGLGLGPAAKKRRLSYQVQGILDQVYNNVDGKSYWQWLSLISSLLGRHPQCLSEQDLELLLNNLVDKMKKCKEPAVMGYIFRCCEAILHAEHVMTSPSDLWPIVWDTTLRTVGLNQSELDGHSLLRAFIYHGKMPPTGLRALLKLYKSQTLRRSDDTIKTLIILCCNYTLPDSVTNTQIEEGAFSESEPGMERVLILNWLLPSQETESTVAPPPPRPGVIAEAVAPLILKSQAKNDTLLRKWHVCSKQSAPSNLEEDYIMASFGGHLLIDGLPWEPEPERQVDAEDPLKLIDPIAKERLDLVVRRNCQALQLRAQEIAARDPGNGTLLQEDTLNIGLQLISEAAFLFDAISALSKHGVITETNLEKWSVSKSVGPIMEVLGNVVKKAMFIEKECRDPRNDIDAKLVNLMAKLEELIDNNVKSLSSKSLWSVMSKELILLLLDALREAPDKLVGDELRNADQLSVWKSDLDVKSLSRDDQFGILCVKVLCLFLTSSGMEETVRNHLWNKMTSKLKKHDNKLIATFHSILTCTRYAATRMKTTDMPGDFSELVQSLCRHWHLDAEATCYIIDLLNDVLKHCYDQDQEMSLRRLVVIDIKAFLKKEFGPRFTVALIQCIYRLFQVDPESLWGRWEAPDNRRIFSEIDRDCIKDAQLAEEAEKEHDQRGTTSIVEELVYYIGSPLLEVRCAAVKYLVLVVYDTTTTKQYLWQKTLVARSLCASYSLFSCQNVSWCTEEKMDEGVNRTTTVIHLLTSLIASSATWRKQALRFLILFVKEKNVNIGLVQRALNLVKEALHLKDVKDLLVNYLDYLLDGWIEKKYDLWEFPYQLFGYKKMNEFLRDMEARIMPLLLMKKKYEMIESVCEKTGRPLKEIIESCFAPIMARILPVFASNDSAHESDAHRVYNHCTEALTKVGVSRSMQLHIDTILEYVTTWLWDRDHCVGLLGDIPILPEMDDSFISHKIYLDTLNYIQKTSDQKAELLALLGRSRPIVLQKVMLNLRERVVLGSAFLDRRVLALYQYCAFIHKIAQHLKEGEYYGVAEFLVRDVSHTLLHFMRTGPRSAYQDIIAIACCRYLQCFYERILARCSDAVERLLPTLVSVLVPLAQKSDTPNEKPSLASCSQQLLQLLVVDYANSLGGTIAQLPPFPKGKMFDAMRQIHIHVKYKGRSFSLQEEIDHFLCSVDVSLGKVGLKCPLEGLQFLRSQLAERKEELRTMYRGLTEIRGFSEECAESSLHQLICVLARLSSSESKKVRLEAACCLGELGMTNLQTLTLRPESHHAAALLASADTPPLSRLAAHAISLLTNYLFDEDVGVVKSAAEALSALLASSEGHQAVAPSTSTKGSSLKREQASNSSLVVPFLAESVSPAVKQVTVNVKTFKTSLDSADVWHPGPDTHHAAWVLRLTTALLHSFSGPCSFLHQLAPLCRIKVAFAEELLPLVLSLVLSTETETCLTILSTRIAEFFQQHTLLASAKGCPGGVCMNQASVQCMLNAVHLMRIQQGPKTCLTDPTLKLNYLHVAKAAQFCAAYFSSVMYAEFWFESERRRGEEEEGEIFGGFQSLPPVDYLSDKHSQDGRTLQALLFDALTRLGDTDAVYGCGSSFILDPTMRMSHCKEMGLWEEILNKTNMTLSRAIDPTASLDLVAALGEGNLLHIQHVYLQSTLQSLSENTATADLKPHMLECLWRLGRWDVPLHLQSMEKVGFEWHQFAALRSVDHGNALGAVEDVEAGRLVVMSQLADASLESCASIYKPLRKLEALQEIEEAVKAVCENGVDALLLKWQQQDSLGRNAFCYVRPILEQRSCILHSLMSLPELSNQWAAIGRAWTAHMLHSVRAAKTEGKAHVAKGFLQSLRSIPQQNESTLRRCRLEEAQLEWNVGNGANNHRALLMLRSLLNDLITIYRGTQIDTLLYADVLRLYGTWMAETHNEQPQAIIEKYFRKAIDVLESLETESTQSGSTQSMESHVCLARFADQQYQSVASYLASDKFESKKQLIQLMQSASKALEKNRTGNKDDRKAHYINHKNSELDREEVSTVLRQKDFFLDLALRSYAQVLRDSDIDNLLAFRLLSLWLNNPNKSDMVAEFLASIPSHKFVPLLCQISAHISNQSEPFADTVNAFLERCAIDHPHHTLPIILALAKSYEDRNYSAGSREMKKKEPRVRGAIHLVDKLRCHDKLGNLVKAMEAMFSALISLAYYPVPQTKDTEKLKAHSIPLDQKIRRLKKLDYVLLPTVTLEIRKDHNYEKIIGIHKFEDEFTFVGGINAPKKIVCMGSDGISRPILVKGQDDLRQDAVMQQVFAVMNSLLSTSKETQERRLKIRTYKVIPLSQRSGIIEWCVNTVPLEMILSAVHTQYYPKDLSLPKCRAKLEEAAKKGIKARLAAYQFVCSHFHPAFRYHFIEKYQTPSVWFERRLAYIQSVATNSMVGYILGLGDRHVQNILVDLNTAEVVHIDFGIAFDQGRILPTPETVPFRLTRDIEDAMGLSGVEGVFRRCCEKTMTVLRRNEGTILAILEVLLYDPLFEWTKTPKKVAMRQLFNSSESCAQDTVTSDKSSTEVNAMAERALSRLHQKLQGTEEGSASSIEGQVNRLIQEAREPANLCRLFPGWRPFL